MRLSIKVMKQKKSQIKRGQFLVKLNKNVEVCRIVKYVEVDVNWLLKIKIHFDKLEKIESKIKQKNLRNKSTN